jgi:SAM-dependent methyltransferase
MPALETPWQAGRLDNSTGPKEVLFGRMYEDCEVDAAAFQERRRIFCIASAGCTALRLADDHEVTAVDINPVQLDYAKARAAGAHMRRGAAERFMALGRPLLRLAGWSECRLKEFLCLEDPYVQELYWKDSLDTRRLRWGMDAVLNPRRLSVFFAAQYLGVLPERFGAVLRARMERCWSQHANLTNVYARALLLGELDTATVAQPGAPIRWACADAAAFLESCPAGSFDGFSISNILDGAPPAYAARLFAAIKRAAAPGAVLVRRSFSEPAGPSATNLAARDRSFLWGVVEVAPVES